MKATIWFTNMLQNIIYIFKYKVVLKFYTVTIFFFFFKDSADMKNSSSWYYMYHNHTISLSSSQKALTYKALWRVFRHWWVRFNHLTVHTESSRYNFTCARSFERHLLLNCFRVYIEICETNGWNICALQTLLCVHFSGCSEEIWKENTLFAWHNEM